MASQLQLAVVVLFMLVTGSYGMRDGIAHQRRPRRNGKLVIDMPRLLGTGGYFGGISWDPYRCIPPLKETPGMPAERLQKLSDMIADQLAAAMASILNKDKVDHKASWMSELSQAGQPHEQNVQVVVADPRTSVWRDRLTVVLSKVALVNGILFVTCPEAPPRIAVEDIGKDFCANASATDTIKQLGHYRDPLMSITDIAYHVVHLGFCSVHPDNSGSYGQWLIDKRMMTQASKTFHVDSLEEDAVIFLFDVLYEKLKVFTQQYWLGAIMMQNPFDMMSITDIIYTVRPDLIIETGTANGGSALLWASIMHLNEIEGGRIITMDLVEPSWDPNASHWGGKPRTDATKHKLWKEYVTFIKGSTLASDVHAIVKEAAAKAKNVLVLLDSHHASGHVAEETKMYCPFVTVNSFCIVEDTKLSRYNSDGPMPAALDYARQYPLDFMADRSKELFYTQHAMGYLKRIAIKDAGTGQGQV